MINNHNLTSLLIPSQLPEHIRDDPAYANFVVFLQAYYEWLEEDGNITERAKNLLNYKDVDKSTDEFLKYYYNDFLSYFPEEILEDKTEVIKLAKQLYQYKGTPASYQLLFRILYNSDVEFLNTKDVTLKASAGLWYVAKSLKLATDLINISEITITENSPTGFKITIKTNVPHYLLVGDEITVSNLVGTNAPNGTWTVSEVLSLYEFRYVVEYSGFSTIDITNATVYIPKGYANEDFLLTNNLRIFGETSKSIATIENSVIAGKRLEVFISDIERLFESGEYVRIVDSNNNDVHVTPDHEIAHTDQNGNYPTGSYVLRAKILGQISQVIVNQKFQGSKYQGANTTTGYIGDPVIFDGGLNISTGHGAVATIQEVTTGSISRILVDVGGYGYTEANDAEIPDPSIMANTKLAITYGGGALAHVGGIKTTQETMSTVTFIPRDMIPINYDNAVDDLTPVGIGAPATVLNGSGIQIGAAEYEIMFANNFSANATTTLANAFNFITFSTGSISAVIVDNGGGGIDSNNPPVVEAKSLYKTCGGDITIDPESLTYQQDIASFTQANLKDLGILAPIQIISAGTGYEQNSIIELIGGSGHGANAIISSVNSAGSILTVDYTANGIISLGGLGYQIGEIYPTQNVANTTILNTIAQAGVYKLSSGLPLVKPPTTAGSKAVLVVPGILGDGSLFNATYNGVGNITKINISDYGEDYITQPKVSLKVQDIIVYGFLGKDVAFLPQRGDVIYQGDKLITATYKATVDSIIKLIVQNDPTQSIYIVRVYNYTSLPDIFTQIKIQSKSIKFNIYGNLSENQINGIEISGITNGILDGLNYDRFKNGILVYGDGSAKATATFLNGLTISNGQYLDTTGQPSSYNILQSESYNNFTYQITVEKEISKYRKALLDLLHPTGMKVIGRYPLKSNAATNFGIVDVLSSGNTISHFTGSHNTGLSIVSDFTNYSNNIIKFNNLYGADLGNFITTDSSIRIKSSNGDCVFSEVISVNNSANTVTLKDNVWLTFANVAQITASSGTNVVHVTYLTNSYDIINNGKYSDVDHPLKDIVRIGDKILVANNTSRTVSNINYITSTIYLSTNLTSAANSLMSVNRTFTANSENIKIFGPVGQQYYPEITDESGNSLISEDGSLILLG
jgi:hypothetical protein